MNLFSFLRFFRNHPDEPEKNVKRSNEPPQRSSGFFLDKEWPTRATGRTEPYSDRPPRSVSPTENTRLFSFSRTTADDQAEDGPRSRDPRERSGTSFGGNERVARTAYPVERNPVSSRRFAPPPDHPRNSPGADGAR